MLQLTMINSWRKYFFHNYSLLSLINIITIPDYWFRYKDLRLPHLVVTESTDVSVHAS